MKSFYSVMSMTLLFATHAFGTMPVTDKTHCMATINGALADFTYGIGAEGNPFFIDLEGKTVIADQSRIRKRTVENGIETITYKTKEPVFDGKGIGVSSFESVEKTVLLKRDSQGRINEVSKLFDLERQKKLSAKYFPQGVGVPKPAKSLNAQILHGTDGKCELGQSYRVEPGNKPGEDDKAVTYDKKFCDSLEPFVRKIGSQNAALCSSLVQTASMAFDSRSKELNQEGKKFHDLSFNIPTEKNKPGKTTDFNMAAALQSCFMGEMPSYGMGMNGLGVVGMGGFGWSGDTSAEATTSAPKTPPASKAPGVR